MFRKRKVADLMTETINWREQEICLFVCEVDGEKCSLQMNDFPDEPLYTLTYRGESIDFDDKPAGWTIPPFKG